MTHPGLVVPDHLSNLGTGPTSFAARPSRSWSVEESAMFAARKEFELLKLLATDKKALATARRLGAGPSSTATAFTRSRCW